MSDEQPDAPNWEINGRKYLIKDHHFRGNLFTITELGFDMGPCVRCGFRVVNGEPQGPGRCPGGS